MVFGTDLSAGVRDIFSPSSDGAGAFKSSHPTSNFTSDMRDFKCCDFKLHSNNSIRNPDDMADIHSAPVAKACSNCAKAKAKCDSSHNGKCSR